MDFLHNFSKKKPATTPSSKEVKIIAVNPFTTAAIEMLGEILYKCPTCSSSRGANLQQIDLITGVNAICSACKNVCHVPGGFKAKPKPPGMVITGGVRIPIAEFADWYYGHPFIKSLIESGKADLLNDYGLWAYCSSCFHQFPATVLCSLPIAQGAGDFVFIASTTDSATDMSALRAGHCSHCQNKNLIVIATEIPDYVREVITNKKK